MQKVILNNGVEMPLEMLKYVNSRFTTPLLQAIV
ncbi:hypothetical protein HPL003_20680 [Paenibacillus terrae HPL-003]|uniref:Uncharacterized protein n=1 Tax=Paenibacillus terrae (strain HPL-003) TaxID=985665 RepID=G7VU54_PAETH|nr:hypothetical protein HPL003_20680 [Paenibacillus terrae HPL-003]